MDDLRMTEGQRETVRNALRNAAWRVWRAKQAMPYPWWWRALYAIARRLNRFLMEHPS